MRQHSKISKASAQLKIARISTVAFFVETQLKQQIKTMVSEGMAVTVIASEADLKNSIQGVTYKPIRIPREISVFDDLLAVFKLTFFFRSNRFDIVHSTTPKAGLLTAIAGYIARVPVRIHTYTGQVWVEKKGLVRLLSIWGDRLIGLLNTQCYADSPSQVRFLLKNKILSKKRIDCLGFGSLAGVDLARFNSGNYSEADRRLLRTELSVPAESKVLTFIGRCTRDKGVAELLKAFEHVIQMGVNLTLLVVGPVEGDVLDEFNHLDKLTQKYLRLVGHSSVPERYLSITDLLVLPSYREGFGTVVIEAAAMGVPAIGTRIYGLQDAIVDNKTGCLVEPKNVQELAHAILSLVSDDKRRHDLGTAALDRVKQCFSDTYVNRLLFDEYQRLSLNAGIAR